MRKTISTQDLKTHIGEVVDTVRQQGDHYIIERRGKPVATVVPIQVEEADRQRRQALFELMDRVAQRNRNVPAAKINRKIEQAVREVRTARCRKVKFKAAGEQV